MPNGGYTPTLEYMEMFPMATGESFDFDKAVQNNNMFLRIMIIINLLVIHVCMKQFW